MPKGERKDLKITASLSTESVRRALEELKTDMSKLKATTTPGVSSLKNYNNELNALTGNTDALKGKQSSLNDALQNGQRTTNSLAGSVGKLVGAYAGWKAISGIYSAVTNAARDAEQAQFNLTASVKAASREFQDTGGLDEWQNKIKTLSDQLKIFSESDIANAAARTVDMTKRLGMSADQMEELIKRTADLSAGKTTLEGGIERVTAALRGEAESAEFLGLTLNETYIKSWYESNNATNKAWKNLTDIEKAQARYNVLLEQSAALQGRANDSARTFDGALQLVKAQISDAIANNEDLGDALARVAELLSDNADEIADVAAAFATGIGDLVEFVIHNKELLGVLIGSGGLVMLTGNLGGAISNVGNALKTVGGIKTPDILGTSGDINAALLARIGLYGLLAAEITAIVASAYKLGKAREEEREATKRLSDTLQEVIDKYKEFRNYDLPGDIAAAPVQSLKQYQAEISKTTAYWQAELTRLREYAKSEMVTEDPTEYTRVRKAIEVAEKNLTASMKAREEVSQRLNEVSAETVTSATKEATAVDKAAETQKEAAKKATEAAEKQTLLNNALKEGLTPVQEAKVEVLEMGDAYEEANRKLQELTEGEEGYDKALKANLTARKNYVEAVENLREQQLSDFKAQLENEEFALDNSIERQLVQLEGKYNDDLLTKKEFTLRKAELEEEYARQVLGIRTRMYEKLAAQEGADQARVEEARQEMLESEIDLERAVETTRQSFDRLYIDVEKTGEAGKRAGLEGKKGMDEWRDSTRKTKEEMREARKEAERLEKAARRARSEARKEALKEQTGDRIDAISNTISGFSSLAEMEEWASQKSLAGPAGGMISVSNMQRLMGGVPGSQYSNAMNRYAKDLYMQKLNELTQKQGAASTATTTAKQMTVNLKAPGGETVSGSFAENDAGALLDILRKAGLTTA